MVTNIVFIVQVKKVIQCQCLGMFSVLSGSKNVHYSMLPTLEAVKKHLEK